MCNWIRENWNNSAKVLWSTGSTRDRVLNLQRQDRSLNCFLKHHMGSNSRVRKKHSQVHVYPATWVLCKCHATANRRSNSACFNLECWAVTNSSTLKFWLRHNYLTNCEVLRPMGTCGYDMGSGYTSSWWRFFDGDDQTGWGCQYKVRLAQGIISGISSHWSSFVHYQPLSPWHVEFFNETRPPSWWIRLICQCHQSVISSLNIQRLHL